MVQVAGKTLVIWFLILVLALGNTGLREGFLWPVVLLVVASAPYLGAKVRGLI